MLQVRDIDTFYGNIQALWSVSVNVDDSEVVALVGVNGAGKTTLVNTISGLLRPAAGSVEFLGQRIDGLDSHIIVELGISHIPEGRMLFPDMSVRENLEMGAYTKRVWNQKEEILERVYKLFPISNLSFRFGRHGRGEHSPGGGSSAFMAWGSTA